MKLARRLKWAAAVAADVNLNSPNRRAGAFQARGNSRY